MEQDWYCNKCKSYIDSKSVTYEETHDLCGNHVYIITPLIKANSIAEQFYPNPDYIGDGVDITPAFREGFIQGYSLHKNILYFNTDKKVMVNYNDDNINITHNNETGEFEFNLIRFRGDAGETLTPVYK